MLTILLFPLKVLLIFLDLMITLVTFGWVGAVKKALGKKKLRTVPVINGGDESHRVNPDYKGNLITTPREGVDTLYELFRDSATRYASRDCLGDREFLGWKSPTMRMFGKTKWITYEQVLNTAHRFGASLCKEGLVAAPKETSLDRITKPYCLAIFENTCPEWLMSAFGAFSQSIIVTTIYATLGLDAVVDAINDASISAIVCNKLNVKNLVDRLKDMPSLKLIIYTNNNVAPDDQTKLPDAPKGVKIVSFNDFCNAGDTVAFAPNPPSPDTTAVIMYTSGSTGKPKGVVIPHRAALAAVAGFGIIIDAIGGKSMYMGYLPLAHILELLAELLFISNGAQICYADPKSLTTKGATPMGALEQYRPTLMAGVPKIWDVIKKGIEAKVGQKSFLSQYIFNTAVQARSFALRHGYDTPLFKKLVFEAVAKPLGGNLSYALSGGGPINPEVQDFVRTCFGCVLVQGYGLTETCAALTIQDSDDLRPGVAGMAVPCAEIKLVSTPDVSDKAGQPYLTSDRVDHEGNPVLGRGEIWVRGPHLAYGYYMMPQKTREDFREQDGFFMTGDIGQFLDDGSLRIVDRKKNLVKMKGGEYIALERMEMVYNNCSFIDAVAGGICCYGDGEMDRPVALMQLSKDATMNWAKSKHINDKFEVIKDSPELYQAIMANLLEEHKKGGLSSIEKLKAVTLLTEPWTPENGCLTAANKLQRTGVIRVFEKDFEQVRPKGIY